MQLWYANVSFMSSSAVSESDNKEGHKKIRNFSTWYMVSGDVIQQREVMFNFPLNTTKVNPEGGYIKFTWL